ncbi:transcriptional regulator [Vibrio ichthyoenteri ATCC 700023]|uniref:Transcriptional regulator n=1 Tax=Vibrio ichthyoenteri ATCC 700023 TaxID=870968 RepID=F9RW93_9VIBR|nr:LysR family transcriptional regulator [Vibrio ichthyoenteri]EGU49346.1 transcriptional regulator [Vibrio ichthyoenteri ATCC 700023]
MNKDLFYSLDLNLLRTFLVLSQECNMRKASKRLFVSQPAISQALQKLRHHFEDELFVKVHGGLEATPFAQELADNITPHLDGLASTLNRNPEFDPLNINTPIRIAVAPIVLTCLSGTLFQRFQQLAPNCTIELISWNKSTFDEMKNGDVLFGINYDHDFPQHIYSRLLVELTSKVIVRKDHPVQRESVNAHDMHGYDIASIIIPGWNDDFSLAAEVMRREGVEVNVKFRSEFVMAAVDVVVHSDLFLPHSNLFPIHNYPLLRSMNAHVNGEPFRYPVYGYYHSKYRHNPLINWLYEQVLYVLNEQISNN